MWNKIKVVVNVVDVVANDFKRKKRNSKKLIENGGERGRTEELDLKIAKARAGRYFIHAVVAMMVGSQKIDKCH